MPPDPPSDTSTFDGLMFETPNHKHQPANTGTAYRNLGTSVHMPLPLNANPTPCSKLDLPLSATYTNSHCQVTLLQLVCTKKQLENTETYFLNSHELLDINCHFGWLIGFQVAYSGYTIQHWHQTVQYTKLGLRVQNEHRWMHT